VSLVENCRDGLRMAVGSHAANRALPPLHALADAVQANRKELAELESRTRQGDLLGQGRGVEAAVENSAS